MDFTLHTQTQAPRNYTGDARYIFNDGGFLVVYMEDGRKRTYSPSAWSYIEELSTSASGGGWVTSV